MPPCIRLLHTRNIFLLAEYKKGGMGMEMRTIKIPWPKWKEVPRATTRIHCGEIGIVLVFGYKETNGGVEVLGKILNS